MKTIAQFESKYGVKLIDRLGDGKDGNVFKASSERAVKFLISDELYCRELRAYQILRQRNIARINGFGIPRLARHDDPLRATEMSIVQPPFLLDFASAYTIEEYNRFEFSEDVLAETEAKHSEMFGERWQEVMDLCNAFTRYTGLILLDLSLNNLRFSN